MDRAIQVMEKRFGAKKWEVYDPAPLEEVLINGKPASPDMQLSLAMTGDMMLELIEPKEGADYYAQVLRKDRDFRPALPPCGRACGRDPGEFSTRPLKASARSMARPEVQGTFGPAANWAYWNYLDELGHYLELVQFSDDGRALIESLKG